MPPATHHSLPCTPSRTPRWARALRHGSAALLCGLALQAGAHGPAPQGQAPLHAHVHGQATLDVAVDARSLQLQFSAPLDSLLGFERAPRTAAERQQVQALEQRLRAVDQLLRPDPAAGCSLTKVELQAPVLGLGQAEEHPHHGHGGEDHADLDLQAVFQCRDTARLQALDVQLFAAFAWLQQVEVQIAAPQGQFQRRLSRQAPRLQWGR